MIITRTPLRISFLGGGSDLPAFYQDDVGFVVSATIDKYITIAVAPHYEGGIRLSYSHTEHVPTAREVAHPLVRAALQMANIRRGVEIVSIGDVPAGTGLGSSSAFTVGLLAALYAHQGEYTTPDRLASDACHVELSICREPIGKQDQYAAAFGGLRCYTFYGNGAVGVEALALHAEERQAFASHLLLLDTGQRRAAGQILAAQQAAMLDSRKRADVRSLANMAHAFRDALLCGNLAECGDILDGAWRLKRNLASGVTTDAIDAAYATARKAGALGGKLCGAGGGGMLLIYAPPETHQTITRAVGLRAVPIALTNSGVQVVYAS